MRKEARALCIQDTTELDFTDRPGIEGLGRLGYERQRSDRKLSAIPCIS
jgi:hypothetical protein